jgi:hypothetical protein
MAEESSMEKNGRSTILSHTKVEKRKKGKAKEKKLAFPSPRRGCSLLFFKTAKTTPSINGRCAT